jgi:two-component system, LytTR family, sensor kinase
MRPRSPPGGSAPIPTLASIVGFWSFYGLLTTTRSLIVNPAHVQLHLLGLRAWVCVLSAVITLAFHGVLVRAPTANLRRRIVLAAMLAGVAAAGFGAVNAFIYRGLQDCPQSQPSRAPKIASPGLVTNPPAADCMPTSIVELLAEHFVEGYFLMVAWAALYLAFGYAAEVGAWERRAGELRAATQLAELRALRYQVNPHFLFNTLNSLSALVMAGRASEAERMIARMSTFFRTSLAGDPTDDVALRDEIELQRLYLEIEAVRFPDRLRFAFDVPDAFGTVCVPGLILQPLVENAVKHGVARSRRLVTITVSARADADGLALTVTDDGAATASTADGTGVGLRNVADRLAARYGGEARCEWRPRLGGGFVATLWIPAVRDGC